MIMENLQQFRQEAYECLGKARDALFELMDAVLLTAKVSSYVELSLSPVFRRSWSSIYEALEDSSPDPEGLMKTYIEKIPQEQTPILVGDHTSWSRPAAVTLRERTYEHAGGGIGGGKPITLGQGYSSLAWIPEEKGSWVLPLRHERITSSENPLTKAAAQLRQVCTQLSLRPISIWDSEYGNASFVKQTVGIAADKLMRLRPNRCLWREPPPYGGKGRPRAHGEKFSLKNPQTWGEPDQQLEITDEHSKVFVVSHWSQLHFRDAAEHPIEVICITPQELGTSRRLKPLWLSWVGETMPSLERLFLLYRRRFAIEHWYRFLKQRLHWCLPKLGTPETSDRWSHLMPILTWQLWLARSGVSERPLPWQKPLGPSALSG